MTTGAGLTESAMLDGITAAARRLGLLAYHTHNSRHSEAGFPDLCIVGNGRIVFMELKGRKGRLSDAQNRWLLRLAEAGLAVFVVYPEDYDKALAYLQEWTA